MGAVVGARGGLVAGEVADGAAGFLVEPVAVGVKVGFGEVFVKGDLVAGGEGGFDVIPGGCFHFEAGDVLGIVFVV